MAQSEKALSAYDDTDWLRLAFANKGRISRPTYSQFRVYAVIVYKDSQGETRYVTGTNTETGHITGSICAERAAIVRMRELDCAGYQALYIVSDAPTPLAPGLLCREFLTEFMQADLRVVLASWPKQDVAAPNAEVDTREWVRQEATLGEMFPYPYLYLGVSNAALPAHASSFAQSCSRTEWASAAEKDLYTRVVEMAGQVGLTGLHPMQLAAGALTQSGKIHLRRSLKGQEYGTTTDPIVQLVSLLQDSLEQDPPIAVLQADSWGVLHSPNAYARSMLFEHGMRQTELVFHDKAGKLVRARIGDLVSHNPDITDVLGHDQEQKRAQTEAKEVTHTSEVKVLCFGDSLTGGYSKMGSLHTPYSSVLTERLLEMMTPLGIAKVRVHTSGIDGRFASEMVRDLPWELKQEQDQPFNVVIVLGGTNDVDGADTSADDTFAYLKDMYEVVLASKAILVAVTVPEIQAEATEKHASMRVQREKLNALITQFCRERGGKGARVALADLCSHIPFHRASAEERQLLWDDGLHFTKAGYERMGNFIADVLHTVLPVLTP